MKVEGIESGLQINQLKNKENGTSGFSTLFENFVKDINNDLKNAKVAEEKIANGEVNNINELLYTIEKSEISLRLITEMRNKALESYQEIMRMQV